MKARYIIVFAAAALGFSACVQTIEQPTAIGEQITIHAWNEGAQDTKTMVVDGGTQVLWEPQDEINVFYKGSCARFTSQNTEPVSVADFTGTMDILAGAGEGTDSGNSIWGLYPYRADASSDGQSVTTELPCEQTGRAGSFDRNTHITVACSDSRDLAFYNVTGGIRFSLTQEGIKSVTLRGNGMSNEPFSGVFTVSFENGEPVIKGLGSETYYVTLAAPDNGSFQTGKWYYIETLPVSFKNGFKLLFRKDSEFAELYSDKAVSITRGKYGSIANVDKDLVFKPIGGTVAEPVDLGLSVKWASWNLGATAPAEIGDFIAWGELQPKISYSPYGYSGWSVDLAGQSLVIKKYNSDSQYGNCDHKHVLDSEDDAASVRWGGNWRIPTEAEWNELIENCTWTWTNVDGMNGFSVTGTKPGFTDKSVFFPAAGGYEDDEQYLAPGTMGVYWTSIVSSPLNANYLSFDESDKRVSAYMRSMGISIRPVEGAFVPVASIAVGESAIEVAEGSTYRLEATVLPDNATVRSVCWESDDASVAKVTPDGTVQALKLGSTIIHAYSSNGLEATCSVTVKAFEPTSVDLGLSVKWATCNLGAVSPEQNGSYFAWGETAPKEQYDWNTYKWCNGSESTLTKYNSDPESGTVDYKFVLDPEDDAARAIWGGNWRMPVREEIVELLKNTTRSWETINGVLGVKLTSKIEGYTDKWIFLALQTGYKWYYDYYSDYEWALYFGASLINPFQANIFYFNQSSMYINARGSRAQGLPIRPVDGEFIPTTSISLSETSLTLKVGETADVTAYVLPDNATAYSSDWIFDDESIATLDSSGYVIGVAPGKTVLRAVASGGQQAICTITVVE